VRASEVVYRSRTSITSRSGVVLGAVWQQRG
jgi:hypothetical protein